MNLPLALAALTLLVLLACAVALLPTHEERDEL